MPRIPVILMFTSAVILQLIGVTLLPLSAGFTKPLPSAFCLLAIGGATILLARIIVSGVGISILFPLLAAMIPLATILIGILFFHESASGVKIALLVMSCLLVGAAAKFG